jgi:hypothetical protein
MARFVGEGRNGYGLAFAPEEGGIVLLKCIVNAAQVERWP